MKSSGARMFRKPSFRRFRRKKKTNDKTVIATKKTPSALEDLPAEVKKRLASFLSVRDLLHLDETSKCLKRDLGITVVSSPLRNLAYENGNPQPFHTSQSFLVVIPIQESLSYALALSCHVVANRYTEGVILIVEQDLPENSNPETLKTLSFRGFNIVARASTKESRKVVLPFFPKVGKVYRCWVNNPW
eukprot:CAMPEP_0113644508 /NCGR_PEP_ID=MMETSP0017_2-20120614/23428_1 /TAXON_ID=2856 /ORGANISM="Cylindrotheca closterium" /LENGTH=188 /DNA_ID=CAMNT_0000556129 /DNA_START=12 /DNA_END=575 /DNA_ORIENTATION=+ /assembly_acc=CAM_ASM_000147